MIGAVSGCGAPMREFQASANAPSPAFARGIFHSTCSDSGTFPLFTQMVAGTMEFLESNKQKLAGFNRADNPYWIVLDPSMAGNYYVHCFSKETHGMRLGDHLIMTVDQMLAAFKAEHLFDWLRDEWSPNQAQQ